MKKTSKKLDDKANPQPNKCIEYIERNEDIFGKLIRTCINLPCFA